MATGRSALLLALAAALLLAPSLIVGNLPSHSSPQNLTWATQFADQFRAGILYPRWPPDSYEGLGGSAFYFYIVCRSPHGCSCGRRDSSCLRGSGQRW